ncbi:MAG: hypothetical protein KatS3mg014_0650 [Actinomycetota bacterium]|nr:MAG: hypothetical protein KatS3mg014_0650 [Actinomycetota bacterium]
MGKHEPPTGRSFYISVATSTLRAAIVIALVVGGIVLIDRAFPANEGVLGGGAGATTSPPASPTQATSPGTGQGGGGQQEPEGPQLAGVDVAVRNGTGVTGLARDTAEKLQQRFGVNPIQIDDAPTTVSVTTVYFRRDADQDEAELLARRFFGKLDVQAEVTKLEAGSGVEKDVRIAIYLGTDYATAIA